MEIIEIWRTCEDFFESSKPKKTIDVQGTNFVVPADIKYVCVEPTRPKMGVLQGFQKKPEFHGHWKRGKEVAVVIACIIFEGDASQWLIEV